MRHEIFYRRERRGRREKEEGRRKRENYQLPIPSASLGQLPIPNSQFPTVNNKGTAFTTGIIE
ncbi:MAG: hypothetical protein HC786_18520 [Richelia sp. CSU_2_1]|nr:hypothetical protein [Richelia sp. CSU_2_1]